MHEIPTPSAGLRPPGVRLRNKSNDIIRAAVVVPAGSELEADEYVAGQLQAQSAAFAIQQGLQRLLGGRGLGRAAGLALEPVARLEGFDRERDAKQDHQAIAHHRERDGLV